MQRRLNVVLKMQAVLSRRQHRPLRIIGVGSVKGTEDAD